MTDLYLPDVAHHTSSHAIALAWVGMQGIALPIQVMGQRVAARVDAGVSLDALDAKGIHMSRLYLVLGTLEDNELDQAALEQLLRRFLATHHELSTVASVRLRFDCLLKRTALVSETSGWKAYSITVEARLEDDMFHVELFIDVPYSSTCPCSAALARQLIQQKFAEDFPSEQIDRLQVIDWLGSSTGIVATPHSQRSLARIGVRFEGLDHLPIVDLIDSVEHALGTAVQTAVKRVDEQAFALANGQNLMFCEDAARRLHEVLIAAVGVAGFEVRVEHAESLHAHDAVAVSRWRW
ncbi:GTP cyclohydrolase FolE2 [Pseudomonas entomophila]|uniref:GTP cyclohydrolase FolE2 n=1 Tax=Pseudomonas entomophila TaxID=312306 RepID=UPI003EC03B4D